MEITKFLNNPVLGISRGLKIEMAEPFTETLISAGLDYVEITMNTPNAAEIISKIVKVSNGRIGVGAGTVLNNDDLQNALNSGASFIVMPTLIEEVTDYCAKNGIPNFPGALTPTEIFRAWNAGATMVKVFPSKFFGPDYFKEIKGPFNNIDLLACGGVNADNAKEFLKAGADAVAFGGSIFNLKEMEEGNFENIEIEVNKLIEACK